MSETDFQLDINSYTITELEDLIDLKQPYTNEIILQKANKMRDQILLDATVSETKKRNIIKFVKSVTEKLKQHLKEPTNLKVSTITETDEHMIINRNSGYGINDTSTDMTVAQRINARDNTRQKDIYQPDTMTKILSLDTRFRKNYYKTTSSDVTYDLPTQIKNVVSMELVSLEMPTTYFQISRKLNNNYFFVDCSNSKIDASNNRFTGKFKGAVFVPDGNYTLQEMENQINLQLESAILSDPSFNETPVEFTVDKRSHRSIFGLTDISGSTDLSGVEIRPFSPEDYLTIRFDLPADPKLDVDGFPDWDNTSPEDYPIQLKLGWILGFRFAKYTGKAGKLYGEDIIDRKESLLMDRVTGDPSGNYVDIWDVSGAEMISKTITTVNTGGGTTTNYTMGAVNPDTNIVTTNMVVKATTTGGGTTHNLTAKMNITGGGQTFPAKTVTANSYGGGNTINHNVKVVQEGGGNTINHTITATTIGGNQTVNHTVTSKKIPTPQTVAHTVKIGSVGGAPGANHVITAKQVGGGGSTINHTLTVLSTSFGDKFAIDGVDQATLSFEKGNTYIFTASQFSLTNHPFKFSTTQFGSHGGGTEYTTGVSSNASSITITIDTNAPATLYYYEENTSGMGGTINVTGVVNTFLAVDNVAQKALTLNRGGVYTFDLTDNSLLPYDFKIATSSDGVLLNPPTHSNANTSCLADITVVNVVSSNGFKYVFNAGLSYDENKKYGIYNNVYTFKNVPQSHPIAILNNGKLDKLIYTGDATKKLTKLVNGVGYEFYYGDVTVTVLGDFGTMSIYNYYHGGTGGEDILVYTDECSLDAEYTTNIVKNNNIITFTVPGDAPNNLYYYTPTHELMGGLINCVGNSFPAEQKIEIDGVDRPTLDLIRGNTYNFDISDSTMSSRNFRLAKGFDAAGPVSPDNDPDTLCMHEESIVNIVSTGAGNKYVFNGATGYDSTKKMGMSKGEYIFKNIPINHPMGLLNDGNSNITYTGDQAKKTTKTVNGVSYDFYHGDITVTVVDDFGTISIYCYNHGYMGGENLIKYADTCIVSTATTTTTGVVCAKSETEINVVNSSGNKYVLNGDTSYDQNKKYGFSIGTYIFKNVPSAHPIAILNDGNSNITYNGDLNNKFSKDVNGVNYDFYHGDVTVNVNGNFGTVSVYCYYHGYMGGENLLTYANDCILSSEYAVGVNVTQNQFQLVLSEYAPDTLYYYIEGSPNMGGQINITGTVIERFVIDGVERPTLSFLRGNIYIFDITDTSMSNNALRFSLLDDGSHQGTVGYQDYTNGVTIGANQITFQVPRDAPSTLYYYDVAETLGGGTINVTGTQSDKFIVDGVQQDTVSLIRGNIYVFDVGDASVTSLNLPFEFSESPDGTFVDQTIDPDVKCLESNKFVNVINDNGVNKWVFNSEVTYNPATKWGVYRGTYYLKSVSQNHPIAFLNDGKTNLLTYVGDANKKVTKLVGGVSYDFYYGNITVKVMGDFGSMSIYCYNHGYMGGQDLIEYSDKCNVGFAQKYTKGVDTSVSGQVTFTVPPDAPDTLYYFSSNDSLTGGAINVTGVVNMRYEIDNVKQKTLDFIRGNTYVFNVSDSSMTGYTFGLTTTADGVHNNGTEYLNGVTRDTANNTLTILVSKDAPNALYYYADENDGMGADIGITGDVTFKFAIDGVEQPTLSLNRGDTYVFKTDDATMAGMGFRISQTQDGTHGGGSLYSNQVTIGINNIVFEVPSNAPSTLYYFSTSYPSQGGLINIVGTAVPFLYSYVFDNVDMPLLNFVRGDTYIIDTSDSTNLGHTFKLTSDEELKNNYNSGLNIGVGTVTFTVPADAPQRLWYTSTNNASGNYIDITGVAIPIRSILMIDNVEQKTLDLVRGQKYVFDIQDPTMTGHEFKLSTTQDGTHTTGGSEYIRGVVKDTTSIELTVDHTAPAQLYYYDTAGSNKGGIINITGASSPIEYKFTINTVQQPTLSVTRGNKYVFLLGDKTMGFHTVKFSEIINGTWNGGVEYNSKITRVNDSIIFEPDDNTPNVLYYYSDQYSNIGGIINITGQGIPISNKFFIDGVQHPTLTLLSENTYKFDVSDFSNLGHILRFSLMDDGTHNAGSEYTDGVIRKGDPGSAGAHVILTTNSYMKRTLHYYGSSQASMGSSFTIDDSDRNVIFTKHLGLANSTDPWDDDDNYLDYVDIKNIVFKNGKNRLATINRAFYLRDTDVFDISCVAGGYHGFINNEQILDLGYPDIPNDKLYVQFRYHASDDYSIEPSISSATGWSNWENITIVIDGNEHQAITGVLLGRNQTSTTSVGNKGLTYGAVKIDCSKISKLGELGIWTQIRFYQNTNLNEADNKCNFAIQKMQYTADLLNEDLPFYITIPENILGYEGVSFVSEGIYDNFGTKYIYMVVDDFNRNSGDNVIAVYNDSINTSNILARITRTYGGREMAQDLWDINGTTNDSSVKIRKYFGPVDIKKLRIQFLDEYGRKVDMNQMDLSLGLKIEYLYE
tara:strand:- start:11878 stop:19314 length:7437 start_codon:yes stop_codon:yes gene_type:complete